MSTALHTLETVEKSSHAFVHVNSERCAGCQECLRRCPTHALSMDGERWIVQAEEELCVGCRQCERVCPYSAITVSGPLVVRPRSEQPVLHSASLEGDTSELKRGFADWTDALAEAERCLQCPDPTCVEACPAHNDIPGFIAALRERDLTGAHAILRETSVLPDVCSRVCDTSIQCEGACSWALAGGEAVAIGRLERFVTERKEVPAVQPRGIARGKLSVAVVGSGAAGLAAAWELLELGAKVTMLDKDEQPGGVLRWGIPDFTLPTAVVRRPIEALLAGGLELRLGVAFGTDLTLSELLEEYDAVILAHGAALPLRPPIPGSELAGVEDATVFLTRAKTALERGLPLEDIDRATRVLVLGGGNTAMDVARTARRCGAEVIAVEWMDERFARVRRDELVEARAEGVDVRFTSTVERFTGGSGRVEAAWLRRTRQRRVDRPPRILRDKAEQLPIDHVIFALGYRVDAKVAQEVAELPLLALDLRRAIADRHWIASGIFSRSPERIGIPALQRDVSLAMASQPVGRGWWAHLWRQQAAAGEAAARVPREERVWVAGDALVGPSTVAGAMAHGREAARAVAASLGGRAR